MKSYIKLFLWLMLTSFLFGACHNHEEEGHTHGETGETAEHDDHGEEAHLSEQQFKSLGMKLDTIPSRNIGSYIDVNGQLDLPPQNEASVTAIIGANVVAIKVIEGSKVKKGDVLAYLSHPDLIQLQSNYVSAWNQMQYLEKDYLRYKKLYEEKVNSGKEFQKIQADYLSLKTALRGYEAQLKLLGLKSEKLLQDELYEQVPVFSPIAGYIQLVKVKTGQFVQAQTEMFEIVNIEHIHADFMVFEKDINKVKEGQKVFFRTESLPGKELEATVFTVGKSFEQDPKAIHLHAEIENKEDLLLPGMYIRGRILLETSEKQVLPEAAIVREGDKYFIFTAEKVIENERTEWHFSPVEIIPGDADGTWVEIKLLQKLAKTEKVAWNNAYYLMAEMKKGEAGHAH